MSVVNTIAPASHSAELLQRIGSAEPLNPIKTNKDTVSIAFLICASSYCLSTSHP